MEKLDTGEFIYEIERENISEFVILRIRGIRS